MLFASMIVIGDELLGGYVADANSPWLAELLRDYGVPFERIHVVGDDLGAINEALTTELGRARPRLIVTSGGIGSTPDDITYTAVAASLKRPLVRDETMAERVEQALEWSRQNGLDVDDAFASHMYRMAEIPKGARLIYREDGWLPAVLVEVDEGLVGGGVTIAILPGVPREFRSIMTETVGPNLLAGVNPLPIVREIQHRLPESALNAVFRRLIDAFPHVKLGSYPGYPMIVRLSGFGDDVRAAAAMVDTELEALMAGPAGAKLEAAWQRRHANDV